MIELNSSSLVDTNAIAQIVAEVLKPGDLLLASGDLGAGKTTFAKSLGSALGVTDQITSPTFVLLCSYDGRLPFHHVDAYRLDQLNEVIELGLLELLDEGGVSLVEWGDVVAPALPNDYLTIHFAYTESETHRNITMEPVGNNWLSREDSLRDSLDHWLVGATQ